MEQTTDHLYAYPQQVYSNLPNLQAPDIADQCSPSKSTLIYGTAKVPSTISATTKHKRNTAIGYPDPQQLDGRCRSTGVGIPCCFYRVLRRAQYIYGFRDDSVYKSGGLLQSATYHPEIHTGDHVWQHWIAQPIGWIYVHSGSSIPSNAHRFHHPPSIPGSARTTLYACCQLTRLRIPA
ncbi:unnamed protein product [Dicrocoelium dendriticum]|nr:unnamed protein product [Dicrocoelium dendriticum]